MFHLGVNCTCHLQRTPPTTNKPLPTFLRIFEEVLQRLFRFQLYVRQRILFYLLDGIKSSSFSRWISTWVTGKSLHVLDLAIRMVVE